MINRYPLWKNLLVAGAILLGMIYALPNIYPPDFAIQISNEDVALEVSGSDLTTAVDSLDAAGLPYFDAVLKNGSALIRFPDDDSQLQGRSVVQRALHDRLNTFIVALNAAPTTPQWLTNIGAEPMKYGLDLRGGVHFLMEVDTEKTISDRIEAPPTRAISCRP